MPIGCQVWKKRVINGIVYNVVIEEDLHSKGK